MTQKFLDAGENLIFATAGWETLGHNFSDLWLESTPGVLSFRGAEGGQCVMQEACGRNDFGGKLGESVKWVLSPQPHGAVSSESRELWWAGEGWKQRGSNGISRSWCDDFENLEPTYKEFRTKVSWGLVTVRAPWHPFNGVPAPWEVRASWLTASLPPRGS